jgi:tRNA threonylcarbamoyladenosine biosynthesis protein TsaE
MIGRWYLNNLDETRKNAEALAPYLIQGDVLLLQGDLGTGKTTWARFLIQYWIGIEEQVLSPSFPLVCPYDTPLGELWHVDLYRLREGEDLALGLSEHMPQGLTVIEWPERLSHRPPEALCLHFDSCDNRRYLEYHGSALWRKRLSGFLPEALKVHDPSGENAQDE